MSTIPQDLNWVKARAACTIGAIFSALHRDAEEDVSEANALNMVQFTGYAAPALAVATNGRGNHFVVHEQGNVETAVKFTLRQDRILINFGSEQLVITITLSDDGRCKLRVNDELQSYEQWQVRRRVLESLFFGNGRSLPSTPQIGR
ncbi:MAG: hypothetical protein WA399_14195 [Acidobacteriaceae bacterium]